MAEKPRLFITGAECRAKIKRGIDIVGDVVGSTMGPFGRNVLLERRIHTTPLISNDGKRTAKATELKDPVENMAAQILINAAEKTDLRVGDGTTGTIVLAQAIVHEAFRRLGDEAAELALKLKTNAVNVVQLRRDILAAKDAVLSELKAMARPIENVEDLTKVATTSVEDPQLGKVIAEMVWKVGAAGHIFVEEGWNYKIETEIIEGMQFDGKYAAQFMVTDANKMTAEYANVPVLVTNHEIDSLNLFSRDASGQSFVVDLQDQNKNAAVIFAWKFGRDAIAQVGSIFQKSGFRILLVKLPSLLTEQLKDIALYSGATFIDHAQGMKLSTVGPDDFGEAKRLSVSDEKTILVSDKADKEKIAARIEELKQQKQTERIEEFRKRYDMRIAALSSGIGVIRTAASTNIESGYIKDKVDDAVNATIAAFAEGVVPGGGLALRQIAESLPESILTEPLKAPYQKIQENAGGFLEIGQDVLDPVKVIRLAVENAASAAATLITTEAANYIEPEDSTLEAIKDLLGRLTGQEGGKRPDSVTEIDREFR